MSDVANLIKAVASNTETLTPDQTAALFEVVLEAVGDLGVSAESAIAGRLGAVSEEDPRHTAFVEGGIRIADALEDSGFS